eukprot:349738-Chlamydomonas_euryale.AAC.7
MAEGRGQDTSGATEQSHTSLFLQYAPCGAARTTLLPNPSSPKCTNTKQAPADMQRTVICMQVRLLLLSALCGEHLLLLGPPGVRTNLGSMQGCY